MAITDTIQSIVDEMGLPAWILVQSTEPILQVGELWYDNAACGVGRDTYGWITDGAKKRVQQDIYMKPTVTFFGSGYDQFEIEEAGFAIRVDSGRHGGGSRLRWTKITQIVVRPECNPEALGDALASVLYGRGANHAFVKALTDAETAREWIHEHYETPTTSARENGTRCVSLQRREKRYVDGFSINGLVATMASPLPREGVSPIVRLVRAHGFSVVDLPRETLALLDAMHDAEAAREWTLHRYTVESDEEGDKLLLLRGSERWVYLASPEYIPFPVQEFGSMNDVAVLLYLHGSEFLNLA